MTLKWLARASSKPLPNALEPIAEMVGIGRFEMAFSVSLNAEKKPDILFHDFQSPSQGPPSPNGVLSLEELTALA